VKTWAWVAIAGVAGFEAYQFYKGTQNAGGMTAAQILKHQFTSNTGAILIPGGIIAAALIWGRK